MFGFNTNYNDVQKFVQSMVTIEAMSKLLWV